MTRVILAAAVSFVLVACADPPPNVVLITLDQTGADEFGILDDARALTPNFDRFASEAVLYEQAYSTSSASLSSHASLQTGLHPMQHGAHVRVAGNSKSAKMQPLSDRATTLAEHLRARGHATAAVVANPELRREWGVAQGFEHYDDSLTKSGAGARKRRAEQIADLAIERLESFEGEPFFLFVDFFDPRTSSDARVAALDVELGRLLAALDASPRGNETLIAITADFGGNREDRGAARGTDLYEQAVRVPLALRYPAGSGGPAGLEPGTRVDTPIQNHRLFATFLAAVGIALPAEIKLRPLGDPDAVIFTEFRRPASGRQRRENPHRDFRAIYLFPFKLIETSTGRSEFYDLDKDPMESYNIIAAAPKAYSRLLRMLIQFSEVHPPLFEDEPGSNVWAISVAKLEALGTVE